MRVVAEMALGLSPANSSSNSAEIGQDSRSYVFTTHTASLDAISYPHSKGLTQTLVELARSYGLELKHFGKRDFMRDLHDRKDRIFDDPSPGVMSLRLSIEDSLRTPCHRGEDMDPSLLIFWAAKRDSQRNKYSSRKYLIYNSFSEAK